MTISSPLFRHMFDKFNKKSEFFNPVKESNKSYKIFSYL